MLGMIESNWPASTGYLALRDSAEAKLRSLGIGPTGFSHFGLVLPDVQQAMADLGWIGVNTAWGAAFGCHISRRIVSGVEIELIQPVEPSFLRDALHQHGPGLQHVSFTVSSIDNAVRMMRQAGTPMADSRILQGLHGRIAFFHLGPDTLHVELCEPSSH